MLDVTEYENASDVLRDADIAMYRAKALGKDRYEIFHEGLHPQAYNKNEIAEGLRLPWKTMNLSFFISLSLP